MAWELVTLNDAPRPGRKRTYTETRKMIGLKIPSALYDTIKNDAAKNKRTITQEIVARLSSTKGPKQ